MATILEAYSKRLAVSESVHQRTHNGAKMSPQKKLMIATVLNNTSKFINEAFDTNAPTQRTALGDYKKFCLNISTVALPNLILPDLMLTQPMTSFTGFVTYLRYVAGTTKGGVTHGDLFANPYKLGEMTEDRMRYTSAAVAETVEVAKVEDASSALNGKFVGELAWTPVLSVKGINRKNGGAKFTVTLLKDGEKLEDKTPGDREAIVDLKTGKVLTNGETALNVLYFYDNVEIPQSVTPTSLPTLKAQMSAISLTAHARRIAIYYSQISAFQAKTDYGFDLGDQLAQQAQGELAYEIDTEGVMMLYNGAEHDARLDYVVYDGDTIQGISRSQYYEGFSELVNRAKAIIYQRTQKFAPNYMVVGSNVLTILPYLKGWNAAPAGTINGPYFAGTLDGLKVYVSPALPADDYFFGINGSDLQTSAAVYAPYMAVVPTQLLGFADGTMSQGFSTMYDMKLLSTYHGSAVPDEDGKITAVDALEGDSETGEHSWLLVAGKLVREEQALRIKQ